MPEGDPAAPELRRGAHDAGQPVPRPEQLRRRRPPSTRRSVKLEPKDALGHYNLGVAYSALKRSDDGIRELEEAMDLKPDDYETRVSLGKVYSKKADYKHAIDHLVKATELKPAEVDAWNSLGIARSKTDDKEGAIVAFKKAISLKPDDGELHFGLATVYRRQRKTDDRDRRVRGRGAEEPEAGQGLLRPRPPLLAGQEERRGARRRSRSTCSTASTRTPPRARTPKSA